jgi:hypothetical protein
MWVYLCLCFQLLICARGSTILVSGIFPFVYLFNHFNPFQLSSPPPTPTSLGVLLVLAFTQRVHDWRDPTSWICTSRELRSLYTPGS